LNPRHVIIGTIRGYDYTVLAPFVSSLRNSIFDCDVVFFYADTDSATLQTLRGDGIRLIPIHYPGYGAENRWSRIWPLAKLGARLPLGARTNRAYLTCFTNIATSKFLFALDFLEKNHSMYDAVLLTDVRDVLFQGNPFASAPKAELTAFLEAPTMVFGEDPKCNDPWLVQNYGPWALERLRGHRISCCGTILGTTRGVLTYLRAFQNQIVKLRSLAWGADTSIHNVLINRDLAKLVKVEENLLGAVATLGNVPIDSISFDHQGFLLGPLGNIVPILHQYREKEKQSVFRALKIQMT
jgi:uncharacterized membrane protein